MVDWRARQGKTLENEIRDSLQYLQDRWSHFWFYRVYDTRTFRRLSRKIITPKVPCDFLALSSGNLFGLECKSSKTKRRYGFSYVREHQKESLLSIERAGGEGWILLSWRRWSWSPRKNNRLFGFRISSWLELEEEEELKSVSWNKIVARGMEFKRNPPYWEIDRIFVRAKVGL